MTPIEAAARAIASRVDDTEDTWESCVYAAQAAIAAIRMPSEAMLAAARDWSAAKYGKPIGREASSQCWQVMCEALLAEGPDA